MRRATAFMLLGTPQALTNTVVPTLLLGTVTMLAPWPQPVISHRDAGRLSAAVALELGVVTSVQPSFPWHQHLFWSSRMRGGGEETKSSYWF